MRHRICTKRLKRVIILNGNFVQIMSDDEHLELDFDPDPKNLACRHISIVAYWTNGTRQKSTNYFAEVEQVAFGTGVLVDGLEFSDDKLLQGRTLTQILSVTAWEQITSSYLLISQNRRCYESA